MSENSTPRRQTPAADVPPPDEGGLRAPAHLSFLGKAWWWFDFLILVKLARLRFIAILVLIGLVIGILSAFGLGRLIASQLYDVSAHNPALLAGSTLLLAMTALIACLLPARRAAYVDPIQALRTE